MTRLVNRSFAINNTDNTPIADNRLSHESWLMVRGVILQYRM